MIDFDGTIVDVWERYYRVFCDIIQNSCIPKKQYIDLKRRYLRDEEVAEGLNVSLGDSYFEQKAALLEEKKYLDYDRLIVEIGDLLSFFERQKAIILTKRRQPDAFYSELLRLGLGTLHGKAYVLEPGGSKAEWIEARYGGQAVTLVGDGQEEIQAKKCRNIKVVLVGTGFGGMYPVEGVFCEPDLTSFFRRVRKELG